MRILLLDCLILMSINTAHTQNKNEELLQQIRTELSQHKGTFAVAFENLQTGEQLFWNEKETFHAASTMKTPVMIEVYKQAKADTFSLTDSVLIKNEFKSIVDRSVYVLNPGDDSQQELYQKIGTKVLFSDLVYQMIINSSNLATNLIIERVDGKNVTQTMRNLGAKDIMVLRGVEDEKAFAQKLNNTITAYDLMLIYSKMAHGKIIDQNACTAMINILFDQQYNTIIPALLPKDVKVAHKTGSITGVHHDSGIVYLPDGRKYVLVILSKNLEDTDAATNSMAKVSEMIYHYFLGSH